MKRKTKINRNDLIFFLTIIVQVCTNRTNNVLHTNHIALHMTPNMVKNTQKHGYMKKECLVLELDIIKYMSGHMTLIPRY